MIRMILSAVAAVILFISVSSSSRALEILGTKPKHIAGSASSVPNEQAITKAIWVPGIDDGYVPQGLTIADGHILFAGYKSTDPKVNRGPCRIYRVDMRSGRQAGHFDMPADCGHAGGLVYLGKGVLIAGDTRRLYQIDLAAALADGNTAKALKSIVKLSGDLKASFIDFDGTRLFLGSSEKESSKARGYFLPLDVLVKANGKTISEDAAVRSIPLPIEANGAAFDRGGGLWVTASSSKHGSIQKLDAATGKVMVRYEAVIGIEDLGFDDDGRLWSLSEAGSLRWSKWTKTFPVIFQMDVAKLK